MDDRHQRLTEKFRRRQQKTVRRRLSREIYSQKKVSRHFVHFDWAIIATILIFLLGVWLDRAPKNFSPEWGLSFSKAQAESLGLSWQKTYEAILQELPAVTKIRLSVLWPELEPKADFYDWKTIDEQIALAQKYNKKITLAIGYRLPRWPECHFPEWAATLDQKTREQKILQMLEKIITRYQGVPEIERWQIENEPFLSFFGECPPLDENFLKTEIALVKKLDDREIMLTDSGELGKWHRAARLADIFGTTVYRKVTILDGRTFLKYFFLPPGFYRLKARLLTGSIAKTIISELQAEPWSENKLLKDLTLAEAKRALSPDLLQENLDYARRTGFKEVYLWGAEWWYFMKQNGHPEWWNVIKNLK